MPHITIEDELKRSYLDYAMSVIVSRALPDARDGLKPVHRRILYAMAENGFTHDKAYRKSARIVGDVIGKYHPHGDQAVYDALVRMAQPFSMGLELIDGQGNFGSVDGDPPAAMRYTESRLSRPAAELLSDIEENTVDFIPNYDGTEQEPAVLPARYPNLLVNGAGGIAVGMATNIPPHNLGEVIEAAVKLIHEPHLSDEELLEIVPAPDFPTGGLIMGRSGARQALLTGRGSVIMRGRAEVEENAKGRQSIIITEIPYQVNKAMMVEKIADLVREKRIEGISDLRDESDRHGMRVVIELKREAQADVILNQLYRFSPLQSSFGVNMLALDRGRPRPFSLRDLLKAFLDFREDVVVRRAKHRLSKARNRGHVLVGLAIAVANIDEVIRLIRSAPEPAAARDALTGRDWPAGDMVPLIELIADPRTRVVDGKVRLSEEQARAILDLRLQRLTAMGRDEISDEAEKLAATIGDLLDLLGDRNRIMAVIEEDMLRIKETFAVPRRSEIVDAGLDVEDEDLIPREDMVISVTHTGYVKRTPLSTYRTQKRGGRGRAGMSMKDEDMVTTVFSASTHTPVLFFSSTGMAYKLKVWRLPLGGPTSRGKAFVNLLPLGQGETITSILPLPEDEGTWSSLDVVFATKSGRVRRNKLSDFTNINRAGKIAMKPDEGDGIVGVQVCSEDQDLLLTTAYGRCIRFPVSDVRVFAGRTSSGVRGIRLAKGDDVISMAILNGIEVTSAEARAYLKHATAMRRAAGAADEDAAVSDDGADGDEEAPITPERIAELGAAEQFILTVASDGTGKRSSSYDYRAMGRGGQGPIAHDLSRKPDVRLVASFPVDDADELLLSTNGGQLIRCPVDGIRIAARNTQGVRIIRLGDEEAVVSVERLGETDSDEEADDA